MKVRKLKKGDTIHCLNASDAADMAEALNWLGVKWDFCYEKDGEKGIWIIIEEDEK